MFFLKGWTVACFVADEINDSPGDIGGLYTLNLPQTSL